MRIDRAAAEARLRMVDGEDWWRPVLYSCVPRARPMTLARAVGDEPPTRGALRAHAKRIDSDVRHLTRVARDQGELLEAYKAFHDQVHRLTRIQERIEIEFGPRVRSKDLLRFGRKEISDSANQHMSQAIALSKLDLMLGWSTEFSRFEQRLQSADEQNDHQLYFAILGELRSLLKRNLSLVNDRIRTTAKTLPLAELLGNLNPLYLKATSFQGIEPINTFLQLFEALRYLWPTVERFVDIHDECQRVYNELSLLRDIDQTYSLAAYRSHGKSRHYRMKIEQLQQRWPDYSAMTGGLTSTLGVWLGENRKQSVAEDYQRDLAMLELNLKYHLAQLEQVSGRLDLLLHVTDVKALSQTASEGIANEFFSYCSTTNKCFETVDLLLLAFSKHLSRSLVDVPLALAHI
jgi:hypothetical protein